MDLNSRIIGYLWETPILVNSKTWFPASQLGAFLLMFWYGQHRAQGRPLHKQVLLAGMTSSVILGSEWAHNLSHLIGAHVLGKPMDEMHIIFGMPRCIYFDLDDPQVRPQQHIQRSLAGPLFNAALLPLLSQLRRGSAPGSMARELWDAAVAMNIFLVTASMLPIPGIDGGPILKWSLVQRGLEPDQADVIVRRVNGPLAVLLALGALLAFLRKRRFLSALLGVLSGSALGVYASWIKESEILQLSNARRGFPL